MLSSSPSGAAALDIDGDWLTNPKDSRAGTDPTNAASVLGINRITAGNSATLEFEALSNKTCMRELREF